MGTVRPIDIYVVDPELAREAFHFRPKRRPDTALQSPDAARINYDLTVFKNFEIHGDQKIQFRVVFFKLSNQAWVTTNSTADIDSRLDPSCMSGEPRVHLHPTDRENFGNVNLKRGRRAIQFVLKDDL